MNETNFFRKYIDIINEAPATAINPNDKNAAVFGKQINQTPTAGNRPGGIAFNQDAPAQPKTQVGSNSVQQNPANVDVAATKARDRLQQQMAAGKNLPASQTVDPNQQYGGGYDPNKVKYATGPAVNNQSSGYTAQSQAQNTLKSTQPNTQSPTFTGMAGSSSSSAAAPTFTGMAGSAAQQPSLASQYVAANKPQASTQQIANPSKPTAPEPSLASQYVSANQPQTVAEEDDGDDDLLKSIIRLIKK